MKDDDELEGEEVFSVTWMGVEPRVVSATFTLVIEDDEGLHLRSHS